MTVPVLVTRIADQPCAFPIAQVVETLRPPLIADGTCVHRGETVPAVDAPSVHGHATTTQRCVIVRVGSGRVAILVDDVIAVRPYVAADLARLPPLFATAQLAGLALPVATALAYARALPEQGA